MNWRLSAVLGLVLWFQTTSAPVLAWEQWPGEWHPGRPSLAAVSTRDSAFVEASTFIDSPVFRLELPFRSQKDGSRFQASNCGPATLGMVLDGFGIVGQATDDLRFRSHTYQGTFGSRTGTALQHIARVAEDLGLSTSGLYNEAGQYSVWRMDEIRGQLRLGRPVMALVRLYLVPGYDGVGARWGHYLLLTGVAEDGFFYSDSLQTSPSEGIGRRIPAEQLERAMHASLVPGQAVAFGGSQMTPLAVWTPSPEIRDS
jgi:hypothetical protein